MSISRGLTLPALQIIETPALKAYASGLREGHYVVNSPGGLSIGQPTMSSKPFWDMSSHISATATPS
ncbi:MAG TPA: hypothetical protein VLL28_00520 [Hyphomicrobiaceae bacterium]|nr:hypothetical protein [Hyphomicrobiaceae bacterium]